MAILSAVDCGTLHIIPADDCVNLVDETGIAADTFVTVDISGYVPAGAKGALVFVRARMGASGGGASVYLRASDQSEGTDVDYNRVLQGDYDGADYFGGEVITGLDSNRSFDYAGSSRVDDIYISIRGYYL